MGNSPRYYSYDILIIFFLIVLYNNCIFILCVFSFKAFLSLCIFIHLFSFTAENTDAESDASSQSDGSLELFSSIPTSRITTENRELSSTELRERQTHESSLDKVFDEMIGSCSDDGDKTLTETGIHVVFFIVLSL